jgi:hypothetical protein
MSYSQLVLEVAARTCTGQPTSSIWERLTDPATGKVVGMIRRPDLEAEAEQEEGCP